MKWHRIWGIILRHFYFFRRSPDRISDAFFWPSLNLILWGLASQYFSGRYGANPINTFTLIAGIILWIFIWRGQYELTVNFLGELWDHNLINIFVSPIKYSEWLLALTLTGVIKSLIGVGFASGFAYLLYQTNVLRIGLYIFPFSMLLIMFGWGIGMMVTSIVMRWGSRVQTLAWTSINILSPFIPIFYPLEALPPWARTVASMIPASYVFEGLRTLLQTGNYDIANLVWPTILCLLYILVGLILMYKAFRSMHQRGLISAN